MKKSINSNKFGYVLAVSNLSLYRKNCDCLLGPFYRVTSKSCVTVLMYVLLLLSLCENNATTRKSAIADF